MNADAHQEYDDNLMALLEAIWGEGFMSPGGTDEIDRYLAGVDLRGLSVLDIGCGLGGIDIHLVKQHAAGKVTGIDIEEWLIDRCNGLARRTGTPALRRREFRSGHQQGFDHPYRR
jgi:phosphoethanolamine N-methyltransferase